MISKSSKGNSMGREEFHELLIRGNHFAILFFGESHIETVENAYPHFR